MFRVNKRSLFISLIVVFAIFFIVTARLPYYIYKPGSADELSEMVEVDLGHSSAGEFHLVTVSGGQATPLEYVVAHLSTYQEIMPIDDALPEGFTDEEYRYYQLKMMEDSKIASQVVAYESAKAKVEVKSSGVYVVQTIPDMPAEGIVEVGDRIIAVDHVEVKEPDDLIEYVNDKSVNENVQLTIKRDDQLLEKKVEISYFPKDKTQYGIGIQLLAERSVRVEPQVDIKSGHIGGPSAGLMFALEIHNQLVEEDMTKGYRIAGTGEINFDGEVLRVGGIDKKVIAAHRKGMDLFFVPYEQGRKDSNYEIAKKTAEKINTNMEIVPIDTFEEALEHLHQLERQHESY